MEYTHIFLYLIPPPFLLPSSASTSHHLGIHYSLYEAIVIPSHHMPIPSQSRLSNFLRDVDNLYLFSDIFISQPFLQTDSKYPSQHSHFCSFQHGLFIFPQCPSFCPIHHHWSNHGLIH